MKIINSIFIILLFAVCISCKKDKPEIQQPKPQTTVLKCAQVFGLMINYNNYNTTKFTYNNDSQIVKVLSIGKDTSSWNAIFDLSYNAQNKLEKMQDLRKRAGHTIYFYNNAGLLSHTKYYGFDDKEEQFPTLQSINHLVYNADGRISDIEIHDNDDTLLAKNSLSYDAKGNMIKMEYFAYRNNKFEFVTMREFRYDDKVNPYYKITLPFNLAFNGPNNVTYSKIQLQNVNEINTTETNFNYTYNSNNLPEAVEIVVTDSRFGTGKGNAFYSYYCK
ncbi:MAG: hypothetical protein EOP00_35200 [Pedobacter sp.]|nr:MAG: hypothetical protein EOP00_35200 [Pedobacter sp.]